ncbi:hypothetical protein E4U14_005788 [Claviceps sp. LM454 group G7]|nr:hypothetical protein E4U14_005788 [Claviceps sp. LM454 group G7]
MDLAMPTLEGPFETVVFLGDRMDWSSWYDDVSDIARFLNIWEYVDPATQDVPLEPVEPTMPERPSLENGAKQGPYETDGSLETRERQDNALALRTYDVLYEKYRIDTARYLADLAEYTRRKDNLQKLYRIIYKSMSHRYRSYLKLDDAKTPRDVIRTLQQKIRPKNNKDSAAAALRTFNSKLKVQPDDDKHGFIEGVALAVVDLLHCQGDKFDQGSAVKGLLQALQVLDEAFAKTWLQKGGKYGLLDIVEDFKYKLRLQYDDSSKNIKARLPQHPAFKEYPWHYQPAKDKEDPWLQSIGKPASSLPINEDAFPHSNKKNASPQPDKNNASRQPAQKDELPKQGAKKEKVKKANAIKNGTSGNDNHAPAPAPASAKAKETSDPAKLSMRACPGCDLRHLMRDDAWWENCYIYWELSGVGNIPSHFHAQQKRLQLALTRLQEHPDEMRRAEEWASRKTGGAPKKLDATAANGNANGHVETNARDTRKKQWGDSPVDADADVWGNAGAHNDVNANARDTRKMQWGDSPVDGGADSWANGARDTRKKRWGDSPVDADADANLWATAGAPDTRKKQWGDSHVDANADADLWANAGARDTRKKQWGDSHVNADADDDVWAKANASANANANANANAYTDVKENANPNPNPKSKSKGKSKGKPKPQHAPPAEEPQNETQYESGVWTMW